MVGEFCKHGERNVIDVEHEWCTHHTVWPRRVEGTRQFYPLSHFSPHLAPPPLNSHPAYPLPPPFFHTDLHIKANQLHPLLHLLITNVPPPANCLPALWGNTEGEPSFRAIGGIYCIDSPPTVKFLNHCANILAAPFLRSG